MVGKKRGYKMIYQIYMNINNPEIFGPPTPPEIEEKSFCGNQKGISARDSLPSVFVNPFRDKEFIAMRSSCRSHGRRFPGHFLERSSSLPGRAVSSCPGRSSECQRGNYGHCSEYMISF